jgi:hypothetical protein
VFQCRPPKPGLAAVATHNAAIIALAKAFADQGEYPCDPTPANRVDVKILLDAPSGNRNANAIKITDRKRKHQERATL